MIFNHSAERRAQSAESESLSARCALRYALSGALCAALLAGCTQADAAKTPAGATTTGVLTFDSAKVVSGATQVGAAPMFAVGPQGRRVVAWVSAPDGGKDGRLYVAAVDSTGALGTATEVRDALGPIEPHGEAPPKIAFGPNGALYALWVVGKEVPGRRFPMSALRFARSDDGGHTWTAPASVTDTPQPFGSFNFHALQAARGDTLYAAWLDGRAGKSATFVTRSTDGGRTWAPNVRVEPAGEACPCCRTSVVAGRGDTVYAAWRKVFPGNLRAVVVARSTDGGAHWAAPVAVQKDGWVIDGCPHAGPSMQVDDAGRVHVSWWSGKEGAAGVFYARSADGAQTFDPPTPLGIAPFSRPAHVQMAIAGTSAAPHVIVTWDDGTVQRPRVMVRMSRDGGRTFDAAIAASAPGRSATYPVLATDAGRLSLAWAEDLSAAPPEAHAGHGGMKGPQPLPSVGQKQIVMRTGAL